MNLRIAENIKRLRQESQLTQAQLAERLGVSYQAISRWENETTYPDIELLPSIAALFGVTVDYLLTGQPAGNAQRRRHPAGKRSAAGHIEVQTVLHPCSEICVPGAGDVMER